MNRIDNLCHIAIEVEKLIRSYGSRKDICVTFCKLDRENIEEFNAWDRKRFNLLTGEECFFVWEMQRQNVPDPYSLLYVIPVTADSLLTATSELMNLVSHKF